MARIAGGKGRGYTSPHMYHRPALFKTLALSLLLLSLPCAYSLGSATEIQTYSDSAFNGTLTLLSDGRLQLSMDDGSLIFLGPGAAVDVQTIGKAGQVTFRRDAAGKVIFAADPQLVLIYTFMYTRDGTGLYMTDPKDMMTWFHFDGTTGKITDAQLPSNKKIVFP